MNLFWDNLINKAQDNKEAIINILIARGFLIDSFDGKFYLSNNACVDDSKYLSMGMNSFKLGYVIDNKDYIKSSRRGWTQLYSYRYTFDSIRPKSIEIVIDPSAKIKDAIAFFDSSGQLGNEAGSKELCWSIYLYEVFSKKVPVSVLESYVSYYVKAISSCGVHTSYSCDGNHKKDGNRIFIDEDYPSNIWHRSIWETLIIKKFGDIPYIGSGKGIKFTEETKEAVYKNIYEIADYLYKNRYEIRDIKMESAKNITKKYRKTHSKNEIDKFYYDTCVNNLLGSRLINRIM